MRPSHLAEDNTTSISSVQEFLEMHPEVNNLALVQCTSVFLTEKYLQDAVQLFQNTRSDCVFSVTRFNLLIKLTPGANRFHILEVLSYGGITIRVQIN